MRERVFLATFARRGVVPSLFRGSARIGIGRNAVEALPASLSNSVATSLSFGVKCISTDRLDIFRNNCCLTVLIMSVKCDVRANEESKD